MSRGLSLTLIVAAALVPLAPTASAIAGAEAPGHASCTKARLEKEDET
jgi:hypothetical protein